MSGHRQDQVLNFVAKESCAKKKKQKWGYVGTIQQEEKKHFD
jgi:hypothetical protein